MPDAPPIHILFYDGVCRYCNGLVQLALRHDSRSTWRFSPLQSDFANARLASYGVKAIDLDQIYAIANYQTVHERLLAGTDAGPLLWRTLSGWPRLIGLLLTITPRFIREPLYRAIARNRYRLFGKYDTCQLPTCEQATRFILE